MKHRQKVGMKKPTDFDKSKSLKTIQDATFSLIFAPWNGAYTPVMVYMPNKLQIKACGNFSVFPNEDNEERMVSDLQAFIDLKNAQEKLLKTCLVSPTFDEIINTVSSNDYIAAKKGRLTALKAKLSETTPRTREEHKEHLALQKDIEDLEIFIGFLFPDDFAAFICAFVLQLNNSDISRLTEDMLLDAGLRSEKFGGRPCDYVNGVFTKYLLEAIDDKALLVVSDFRKKQAIEKGSKFTWIGGGKN